MEYILWRYIITPPSHLRHCIYGGDICSIYYGGTKLLRPRTFNRVQYLQWRYMEYILWWYIITSPSHLQKRRYSGNLEYIIWQCSNFFTTALMMEGTWSTYYGGIETCAIAHTTWWRPKHGGDRMLAGSSMQYRNINRCSFNPEYKLV